MIRFYPRDIGLWRELFQFKPSIYPTMNFDSKQNLIDFVTNHYANIGFPLAPDDSEKFPIKFIEEKNSHFGTTHIVHRWTVIGWMKEVSEKSDVCKISRS